MAIKKTVKKTATTAKKTAAPAGDKFSLIDEILTGIMNTAEVSPKGEIKLKKSDLKATLESAFENGLIAAAGGQRVKFPVIGTLVRKEVEARKAGKGVNPFNGEPMIIKARPASQKPRWSFPATAKEVFANKKYW
jgi:nucleoid DNA-binding protein